MCAAQIIRSHEIIILIVKFTAELSLVEVICF